MKIHGLSCDVWRELPCSCSPTDTDDDPRLLIPGPPGGERYLCPLRLEAGPCPWYLDVPPPEFDPPNLMAVGPSYRLTVTHVPMAAVEAAVAAHLRDDHDPAELTAAMVAALRRVSGV